MIRLLIRIGLTLAGNAIGLVIAALVLDDMTLNGAAFVVAVLIFTALTAVVQPLLRKLTAERASALQGGSALIATFLSLVITELVSDGLTIDGTSTWVIATVLVWLITMIAGILLPLLFLKEARERR